MPIFTKVMISPPLVKPFSKFRMLRARKIEGFSIFGALNERQFTARAEDYPRIIYSLFAQIPTTRSVPLVMFQCVFVEISKDRIMIRIGFAVSCEWEGKTGQANLQVFFRSQTSKVSGDQYFSFSEWQNIFRKAEMSSEQFRATQLAQRRATHLTSVARPT